MVEHLIENDEKNASIYKSNLDKALKDIDINYTNLPSEFKY